MPKGRILYKVYITEANYYDNSIYTDKKCPEGNFGWSEKGF